nr:right-handed parallel beta-helix repeat-containing protein [uncultured Solibaculum sp.]
MKSTKKSLLVSGLSVLLSCALLIGITFAWFTDSVTNNGNKIEAGSLQVDLQEWRDGNYISIGEEAAPVFDSKKWEPGYSEFAMLRVVNEGSLALKWNLNLVTEGEKSALGDVIDVYALIDADNAEIPAIPESFQDAIEKGYKQVGTLNEMIADQDGAAHGVLYAKDHLPEGGSAVATAGVILHMREDAGNEYMHQSIGSFDLVLNATQYTYEKDGFDNNQYDAEANYDIQVSTTEELEAALAEAKAGDTISLDADMVVEEPITVDTKGVTLNGNGATFEITSTTRENILTVAADDITVQNIVLDGAGVKWGIYVQGNTENVVIEGCTVKDNMSYSMEHAIWVNEGFAGGLTIKNNTFNRPIHLGGVSNVTVEGNTFQALMESNAITISGKTHDIQIKNNTINPLIGKGVLVRFIYNTGADVSAVDNIVMSDNTAISNVLGSIQLYNANLSGDNDPSIVESLIQIGNIRMENNTGFVD